VECGGEWTSGGIWADIDASLIALKATTRLRDAKEWDSNYE
jgi:hypothetical protein